MRVAVAFVLALSLAQVSGAIEDREPLVAANAASSAPQPAAPVESAFDPSEVKATIIAPETPALMLKPVTIPFAIHPGAGTRHNFFDSENCAALVAVGASLTGDALSTQRGLGLPGFHEVNPIARPFVQNRPGAALYSAASFAFMGGSMYLAHKTNHHKFERILPFAVAGWEGFLTLRNYHLISTSRNTH